MRGSTATASRLLTCGGCGATSDPAMRFCGQCGTALVQQEKQPPPPATPPSVARPPLQEVPGIPMSVAIAAGGINTSRQLCNLLSALMTDILLGKVTPQAGNATANSCGKLLKTVELQHRYGVQGGEGQEKSLNIADIPAVAIPQKKG
jgi:hypothetical protein